MGTQRIQPAMFRSNLRDSHFQTGGIATDYSAANIHIFRYRKGKNAPLQQKKPALLSEGKSSRFIYIKVWYFSVLVYFSCGSFPSNKSLFILK
jgi:hypothetical protein